MIRETLIDKLIEGTPVIRFGCHDDSISSLSLKLVSSALSSADRALGLVLGNCGRVGREVQVHQEPSRAVTMCVSV